MLAVAPDAQGRGVGEALARLRASTASASAGAAAIVLSSLAGMTAAHRLYERLGFARAARAGLVAAARRRPDRLPAGAREWTPTLTFTVTDDDTALAVGSGSLPVLGTPRLLAWCEAATCAAIEPALRGRAPPASAPGSSSSTSPPARSAQEVEVTASTTYVDGRLHRFTVAARHTSATARSSAPARSPGWSSTPSGSCPGCVPGFAPEPHV